MSICCCALKGDDQGFCECSFVAASYGDGGFVAHQELTLVCINVVFGRCAAQ
jgi:hypothetical protein